MYSPGRKKGTVRFAVNPKGKAGQIAVAGSFNDWQPVPLRKQKDGTYAAEVKVAKGVYEYKFIVDDNWQVDPDNSAWAANPQGIVNSLLTVEP